MTETIAEMVERLCPEGVEYVRLGDVAEVSRGKRFVKADIVDSGVPCIHYGEIYTHYGISATETKSFVTEERAEGLRYANPGDVVMATAGETEEDLGMSVAWLGSEPAVIHDACYRVVSDYDAKFLSYYFSTPQFRQEFRRHISTGKISSISVKAIANSQIPVLPCEVQKEIVRVLDEYSAAQQKLEEQLQAEVEARELQKVAFIDEVLESTSTGGQAIILGKVVSTVAGLKGKSKVDFTDGNAKYATYKNIFNNPALNLDISDLVQVENGENQNELQLGDVLIAGSSENFEDVGMSSVVCEEPAEPIYLNSFCFALRFNEPEKFHPDYMKYVFRGHEMRKQIVRAANGVTRINLSKPAFLKSVMTLPSLSVQIQTARVLDEFVTAQEEYVAILRFEITARQTQYETFRDQLLTFPRKELAA